MCIRDRYIPTPVEEIANVSVQENVPVQQAVTNTKKEEKAALKQVQKQEKQKIFAAKAETPKQEKVNPILAQPVEQEPVLSDAYMQQTRFDVKPSLWQRFKNSKLIRTIRYVMKIRVVLEFPALPEGRGEN